MALFFSRPNSLFGAEWHVGEPIPEWVRSQRFIIIHADGHELEALLSALQPSPQPIPALTYEDGLRRADKISEELGLSLLSQGNKEGWSTCDDLGHKIRDEIEGDKRDD